MDKKDIKKAEEIDVERLCVWVLSAATTDKVHR